MSTTKRTNHNGAKWIRRERRLAIYMRDGFACLYCGYGIDQGVTLCLDHFKPRSKGGSNHSSNLITSCMECNNRRQDRPVATFVRTLAEQEWYGDIEAEIRCVARRIKKARTREAALLIREKTTYAKALRSMAFLGERGL